MVGIQFGSDTRGMSNLIGVVLVLGIFMVFAAGVWASFVGMSDSQTQAGALAVMEDELVTVNAELRSVALGPAPSGEVAVEGSPTSGQTIVNDGAGHITVDVVGHPGTELETALGGVVFTHDEGAVAIQGGGVFRAAPGESATIVEAPPLLTHRSGSPGSVTLTVLQVQGSDTINDHATVHDRGSRDPYPDRYVPAGGSLVITVESEYAEAWARYFRERLPEGETSITHPAGDDSTVRVEYTPSDGFYLHFQRAIVEIDGR